jgi:hypothetical protein
MKDRGFDRPEVELTSRLRKTAESTVVLGKQQEIK